MENTRESFESSDLESPVVLHLGDTVTETSFTLGEYLKYVEEQDEIVKKEQRLVNKMSGRPFWRRRGIQIGASSHRYIFGFPTAESPEDARRSVQEMLANLAIQPEADNQLIEEV